MFVLLPIVLFEKVLCVLKIFAWNTAVKALNWVLEWN